MEIVIECTYNKTIFRNEKDGYTIFSVLSNTYDQYKTQNGQIVCIGKIPIYTKGVPLRITGVPCIKNNAYQIHVSAIEEYSNQRETTVTYLSSEIFAGIGPKIANKIVDITGPDVFEFVKRPDAQSILASAIPDISEKVDEFIRIICNTVVQKETYEYIYRFGGNYSHALKLYEMFGAKALYKLKSQCYDAGLAAGLPFAVCDAIAKSAGKEAFDEDRIHAILVRALQMLAGSGHVYAYLHDLSRTANALIRYSAFNIPIPACLLVRAAYNANDVVIETDGDTFRYYSQELWKAESTIVQEATRIQRSSHSIPFNADYIHTIESNCRIRYSDKQRTAFNFLFSTGIKILTGGPGTGKTTVINGLIEAYKAIYPDNTITLCAPTGRAAQRMSETSGMLAYTIHRLLEIKPYNNGTANRDQSDPLPADLIIVDEVSMADTVIFALLLRAIKNGALVILCGDIDQLPSVGPGNVLQDLINSGLFDVNALDVVYRQSNCSNIVLNAAAINAGSQRLQKGNDFEIIEVEDEQTLYRQVVQLAISKYDKAQPYALQVLSSTKKNDAGTYNLNAALQEACNHTATKLGYGASKFKIGDKIIMTKNNYDSGYVNGDVGIIKDIDSTGIIVDINGDEITLSKGLLHDVSLAYAMTIHKSQGSEYTTVIIALPLAPAIMLKRNLLYTAITRAKTKVIIVAQKGAIAKAISTLDNTQRQTMLRQRLNDYTVSVINKRKK